jgi:uncharacterized membrane protein
MTPEKSSTGLEPNLAGLLAYVAGFVSGIALLVIEKHSPFVRFHALQSTAAFLLIAAVYVVVNTVPVLGQLVTVFLLWPATVVLWLVLMFKAYQGERFKLPVVGEFAERQLR